ncbi:MAG: HI0074 family nucleotidyltransferase substrate-binding subunit [Candidatus Ancaeobacter aquaticus]|nr:HI0074 family nucleotidyltransferase substrate-binding subunit [Candidatus Ancaeobacter aquaticus]
MSEEISFALEKLENAINKLKEGVLSAECELEKDGVIHRFKITYELLWKTLKIFIKDQGIDVKTPKKTLKEAFRLGWIHGEDTFLNMMEDRNKTSHIYSKEISDAIFSRIKDIYTKAIEDVLNTLKGK